MALTTSTPTDGPRALSNLNAGRAPPPKAYTLSPPAVPTHSMRRPSTAMAVMGMRPSDVAEVSAEAATTRCRPPLSDI